MTIVELSGITKYVWNDIFPVTSLKRSINIVYLSIKSTLIFSAQIPIGSCLSCLRHVFYNKSWLFVSKLHLLPRFRSLCMYVLEWVIRCNYSAQTASVQPAPLPIRAAHTWQASEWKWVILYLCFPIYSLTSHGAAPSPLPTHALTLLVCDEEMSRLYKYKQQSEAQRWAVLSNSLEFPTCRCRDGAPHPPPSNPRLLPATMWRFKWNPAKVIVFLSLFSLSQCGKVRFRCATGIFLSPHRVSRSSTIVYFCIFYFLRKLVGCCIALHDTR